jgi:hypothetical protein
MAVTQMWVHGNAVTVEPHHPDTIARQNISSFGAKILVNINKFTWMHIPVPTPAILRGVRASCCACSSSTP